MLPSFAVSGIEIASFPAMLFFAFIAGALVARAQALWLGASPAVVWDILPWAAMAGLLGSQLYAFWLTGRFWGGGMVWYGGVIAGVGAAIWRYRRWKLPAEWFVLGGAPAIALGHSFGRIGCFLAGDDWGLPTTSAVGVAFPKGAPPSTAGELRARGVEVASSISNDIVLRVHPTQLYEAAFLFFLFLLLMRITRRGAVATVVAATYLGAYGTWRFVIEFVRAKSDRFVLGMTTAQVISVALVCAAAVLLLRDQKPLVLEKQ